MTTSWRSTSNSMFSPRQRGKPNDCHSVGHPAMITGSVRIRPDLARFRTEPVIMAGGAPVDDGSEVVRLVGLVVGVGVDGVRRMACELPTGWARNMPIRAAGNLVC